MRGRDLFRVWEPALLFVARTLAIAPVGVRHAVLRRSRRLSGRIGMGVRYATLRSLGCARHANVSVREDVYLLNVGGLAVGENVSIHPMSYLDALGGITIGDNVSIAHGVSILSTTHNFDRPDVPINDQGVEERRTSIGDNTWIGARSTIVAGVTIGTGSVIAANSVVTRDVAPNTVVAGAPARPVKSRTADG